MNLDLKKSVHAGVLCEHLRSQIFSMDQTRESRLDYLLDTLKNILVSEHLSPTDKFKASNKITDEHSTYLREMDELTSSYSDTVAYLETFPAGEMVELTYTQYRHFYKCHPLPENC